MEHNEIGPRLPGFDCKIKTKDYCDNCALVGGIVGGTVYALTAGSSNFDAITGGPWGTPYVMQACPVQEAVDCVVSDWTYGTCSVTCGDGTQTGTRTITTEQVGTGAACPELTTTQACSTGVVCPVDCVVSAWTFGACSVTCGDGTQSGTRTVTTAQAGTGAACPALTTTQACSTGVVCPTNVDCVVSAWTFGACSVTCGDGTQSGTRTVTTAQAGTGAACPALTTTQACSTGVVCPTNVDCVVSEWSAYDTCSVTCGGGTQSRTRTITTAQAGTGAACPSPLSESQDCNTQACPTCAAIAQVTPSTGTKPTLSYSTTANADTTLNEATVATISCPAGQVLVDMGALAAGTCSSSTNTLTATCTSATTWSVDLTQYSCIGTTTSDKPCPTGQGAGAIPKTTRVYQTLECNVGGSLLGTGKVAISCDANYARLATTQGADMSTAPTTEEAQCAFGTSTYQPTEDMDLICWPTGCETFTASAIHANLVCTGCAGTWSTSTMWDGKTYAAMDTSVTLSCSTGTLTGGAATITCPATSSTSPGSWSVNPTGYSCA